MSDLKKLPNIGKVLDERLQSVGIHSEEEFRTVGSLEAFRRLRAIDPRACFSTLCSLEGALRGVRWHDLTEEVKAHLRELCDTSFL